MADLRERHGAQLALVRFVSEVCSFVSGKAAQTGKRLRADVAYIRILTGVRTFVQLEVAVL